MADAKTFILICCCTSWCFIIFRHLALSTNAIEKISSLSGMDNLRILSLGRNMIKKIENLDAVAETLEELWISYNLIAGLVGYSRKEEILCAILSHTPMVMD